MSTAALALRQAFMAVGQPRDDDGRWTKGGSYRAFADNAERRKYVRSLEEQVTGSAAYRVMESDYFGTGLSTSINAELRDNWDGPVRDDLRAETRAAADRVLAAMPDASVTLPEGLETYRGVRIANAKEAFRVGSVFTDNGITSVTLDRSHAERFAKATPIGNSVLVKVNVPAGKKAVPNAQEKELAFQPGSRYKVLSVGREPFETVYGQNVTVVEVEML